MTGMRVLDRKLLRDLWRLRAQVVAIATIIGAGIAVVVMSFGTMRSLAETRDAYYERAQFAEVFARVKRAPRSLLSQLEEIPGVARVDLRVVADVTLDLPEIDAPVSARIVSLPSEIRAGLSEAVLRSGAYPDGPDSVLVSEAFAEAHQLIPGDRLVAVINGRKRSLAISGTALSPEYIYALPPGQIVPDNARFAVLWMDRSELSTALDLQGAFNDLAIRLSRGANEPAVLAAVDLLLARYGGNGAYGRKEQQSHAYVTGELDQLALLGRIIPPIFLGVAVFLLNMVVARLVDTEREVIGLFKASGYSDASVAVHYLKFALIVVALGAALGLAGGAWLGRAVTELYARVFSFPFLFYRLDGGVLALALFVSLAAGLGGAFGAVRRVAKLPPAVAMAPPAPTRYRAILPHLRFGHGGLDQASRMVLRRILRFPLRSLATVFGIALSAGGLVASLFALDSLDALIEQHFFQSQRQNITLTFIEPRELNALDAVTQLPGVLAAEPMRVAPVRLVHGSRSRRIGLSGILSSGQMELLVDSKRGVVSMPGDGLVLSGALARHLDATLGDEMQVEVLEGRRARISAPVSAIIEESIGLSARMELSALA